MEVAVAQSANTVAHGEVSWDVVLTVRPVCPTTARSVTTWAIRYALARTSVVLPVIYVIAIALDPLLAAIYQAAAARRA